LFLNFRAFAAGLIKSVRDLPHLTALSSSQILQFYLLRFESAHMAFDNAREPQDGTQDGFNSTALI
jgi:hypothetical protein